MLYRRALTREMGLATGAVLTVLVAIALVVLFIRLLGDVARGELANEAVFAFLGFSLLYFLPVLMTIALFAGVLLPLSRMWRDSEMVIWFNAGLSLMQWMRPVLTFAVPFSLVILLLTLVLNPWAQTKKSEYRQDLRSRSESTLISPGMFAESSAGQRVYYVESLNPLTGIFNYLIGFWNPSTAPIWLKDHALISVVIVDVWMWSPFVMLLCRIADGTSAVSARPPSPARPRTCPPRRSRSARRSRRSTSATSR